MSVRYDRERKQWSVEFEQTGIRVHRRLPKGATKSQADELETKLRREIFDRETLDKLPDLTIGDAIDIWLQANRRKNQKQAQSEAKQWEPWRGRRLRDAPEVCSEAVRMWRSLKPVSAKSTESAASRRVPRASTINRRLMMLKAVCKAMWRQKRINENLSGRIETLTEPPAKDQWLTRAQVVTLASKAPDEQTKAAVWLLAFTGLRASELLTQSASSRKTRMFTVSASDSKTRKARIVPVPKAVWPWLRHLPLECSYWQLRKAFIVARKAAGLSKDVTLHTLRHTCATWLLQAGERLSTVADMLGDTLQTAKRYAHHEQSQAHKAMARLK
jgi:integrase